MQGRHWGNWDLSNAATACHGTVTQSLSHCHHDNNLVTCIICIIKDNAQESSITMKGMIKKNLSMDHHHLCNTMQTRISIHIDVEWWRRHNRVKIQHPFLWYGWTYLHVKDRLTNTYGNSACVDEAVHELLKSIKYESVKPTMQRILTNPALLAHKATSCKGWNLIKIVRDIISSFMLVNGEKVQTISYEILSKM